MILRRSAISVHLTLPGETLDDLLCATDHQDRRRPLAGSAMGGVVPCSAATVAPTDSRTESAVRLCSATVVKRCETDRTNLGG